MSKSKKKIFKTATLLVLIVILSTSSFWFYGKVKGYFFVKDVVEASIDKNKFSPPFYFLGVVTSYMPACIPTPPDGICKNCPKCGALLGPYTCAAVSEVQYMPAPGSIGGDFICPDQADFEYVDDVKPLPGRFIGGTGIGPLIPWIVAVSPPEDMVN